MEKKLSLSALTALVLSSMLGAGVFSLPQNMAAVASPAALIIGWTITGVGILLLAFAMLILTRLRPDLDGGIFTYAREGFGELIGFCSAWGYWLCAVIANVSYLVIVFSALSFFTDSPTLRLFWRRQYLAGHARRVGSAVVRACPGSARRANRSGHQSAGDARQAAAAGAVYHPGGYRL
jgi:Amino acid transporters